jgi:hypothetical protein
VLEPQEVQAHLRTTPSQPVHGVDERQGVEPVVDPTAPEDHLVVRADAVDGALDGVATLDRRLLGDAEGNDGDE